MTDKTEKKNEGEAIDANSPFYIHASDYPKQMHVNDMLTDSNYSDWAQEMTNFLFAKNKMGFVDGSIEKPIKESHQYMLWMRCDAMIKGWLTTEMEKDIRVSVKYANTAAEMWKDLHERFGKESAPRAYELKQSLSTTRQNGASVSAYYTKLRVLWDEIQSVLPHPSCSCDGCSCGIGKRLVELKEKEWLYEFLMGLDNEFSVIKTQILAMKPTPTLGTAYHLVAEDEQQRSISGSKRPLGETAAFQAFLQGKRDNPATNSNKSSKKYEKGEPYVKNEKGGTTDKPEHCTHCGKDGHNRDGCFKRIGYHEWWPGKERKDNKKPKAACVETAPSLIPGITEEQYQLFLKHFSAGAELGKHETPPIANMADSNFEGPQITEEDLSLEEEAQGNEVLDQTSSDIDVLNIDNQETHDDATQVPHTV
ncbi:hypothetical protein L6452_32053 [Arctium lappa]|uniref:Uncharacterized protein n=1 Tax=Arctium lappa TaxID=4217 RepID=A0ACB8Z3E8_ARCLA|nr:hypothetical protein L6452_32053 [Arctium lappa]